jgi:hypothetical protein
VEDFGFPLGLSVNNTCIFPFDLLTWLDKFAIGNAMLLTHAAADEGGVETR